MDIDLSLVSWLRCESCVNAAKHSGVPEMSVFVESTPDAIDAYVRDRGRGFDRSDAAPDRRGIAQSIEVRLDRVEWFGGGRVDAGAPAPSATRPCAVRSQPIRWRPTSESARWMRDVPGRRSHSFRAGVRAEIGDAVQVVGEAATVDDAVSGILASRPDVAVVDVHLPGGGGRAIIERVLAEWPDAVFLALSVSDSAEDVVAVTPAPAAT